MKTKLIIEINCNIDDCGICDFKSLSECSLFNDIIIDDGLHFRCDECLDAEINYKDLKEKNEILAKD